jgi:hypothetical protein
VNEKAKKLGKPLPAGQLPEVGLPYWVQCKTFRCMAVLTKEGKWKSFSTEEELLDVTDVFFT